MRHIVARRVQFGTALVPSMDGITASQWTCRALARDTEKANSYQQNMKLELLNELRRLRNEMAHGLAPVDPSALAERLNSLGIAILKEANDYLGKPRAPHGGGRS